MKTIFDKSTREELVSRINLLNKNSNAQWGKMNVSQMVSHCILWDEMAMGKANLKQTFIGRLFGKIALKMMIKDDKPLRRNVGSLPELVVTEKSGDLKNLEKMDFFAG